MFWQNLIGDAAIEVCSQRTRAAARAECEQRVGLCAQAALDIMSDASDSVDYIMGGMTVGTAILGTLGGGEWPVPSPFASEKRMLLGMQVGRPQQDSVLGSIVGPLLTKGVCVNFTYDRRLTLIYIHIYTQQARFH